MKKTLLAPIIALLVLAIILTSIAYAQTQYTVATENRLQRGADIYSLGHPSDLVRWPDGTLWTTYSYLVGSATEVTVEYSTDNGLNWTNAWTSSYGYNQWYPSICQDSEYNLHVVWAGYYSASSTAGRVIRYKKFDVGNMTWGDTEQVFYWQDDVTQYPPWQPSFTRIITDIDDDPVVYWGMSYASWALKERGASGWSVSALEDSYEGSVDDWSLCRSDIYSAQTFTLSANVTVTAAEVYIKRHNADNPYESQLWIMDTDGTGEPDNLLTQENTRPSTSSTAGWRRFSVAPIELTAGVQYAVVVSANYSTVDYYYRFYYDDTSPTYTGGQGWYYSSGLWTGHPGRDYLFRIYSEDDVVAVHTSEDSAFMPRESWGYGDIAMDTDGTIGVTTSRRFRLRHANNTWDALQNVFNSNSWNTGLVAGRDTLGNTVWRAASGGFQYQADVNYQERVSGVWGGITEVQMYNDSDDVSCAAMGQDHQDGNYYVAWTWDDHYKDGGGSYTANYREYTAGVGWETAVEVSTASSSGTATGDTFVTGERMPLLEREGYDDWSYGMCQEGVNIMWTNLNYDDSPYAGSLYYWENANGWGLAGPVVYTLYPPTDIGSGSATLWGNITFTGMQDVTERGFEYGLSQTPTWSTSETGTFGVGNYSLTLTGLDDDIYYYRAYAVNSSGTAYGRWFAFSSSEELPSTSDFWVDISLNETCGQDHAYLGIVLDNFPHEELVDGGYILASALDTAMTTASGLPTMHTPIDSKLGLYIDSLAADETTVYRYYLGTDESISDFDLIVGWLGNVTTADNASMELGNDFNVEVSAFVDVSAGSDKNIIYKEDAFRLYVGAVGNITVDIGPDGNPTAQVSYSGLASGSHLIEVDSDGTDLLLYIGEVLVGNDTTASVPNNANDWHLLQNNVVPKMEYMKYTVSDVLQVWYQPNYLIDSTTLVDRQNDVDGTIHWGNESPCISYEFDSLVPSDYQIIIGGVSGIEQPDVVSEVDQPTFVTDPGADLPFYTLYAEWMSKLGIPMSVFWAIVVFVLATVAGILTLIFTKGHLLLMVVAMLLVIIAAAMRDPPLIPYWIPLMFILFLVTWWMAINRQTV